MKGGEYKFLFKQTVRSFFLRIRGKRSLHFLHIGKTGGTAVKTALEPYLVSDRFQIKLHPHRRKLMDIPKGDGVIFFLRNPISRFVSGFYSRLRQGQPRIYSPWSPAEKVAFERFRTPNELALALSCDDSERREHAEAAMRSIQHVRDFYLSWFGSTVYFLAREKDVFFIGFQETLSDDFDTLKKKLGLPPQVALPNDEIKSHRNPDSLDRNLELPAVDNLNNWYKCDLAFLEMCRQQAKKLKESD